MGIKHGLYYVPNKEIADQVDLGRIINLDRLYPLLSAITRARYLKQGRKITFGDGNGKIEPKRRTKLIGDNKIGFN